MAAREKKQCPLRFYTDVWDSIRTKAEQDGLNYQQLGEVLFGAYLKNNKETTRLVRRFVESKKGGKRKQQLNELEKDELFRLIESQHSPLAALERSIKGNNDEK